MISFGSILIVILSSLREITYFTHYKNYVYKKVQIALTKVETPLFLEPFMSQFC